MPLGPSKRKFKRIFLAVDIHGSEITFRKFLGAAKFYNADALMMGGDLTAKTITPIVRQKDGTYSTRLSGQTRENLTEAELGPIEQDIANSGPYPVRLTQEKYDALRADPKRVENLFTELMIDEIHRWTDMAEKHLAPLGIPLYWIGGNDDKAEALEHAVSKPHVHYVDEQVVRFDEDHELLGFGWTNPSPWNTPRELPEDKLAKRLEPLLNRLEKPEQALYLMHVPPYETGLDIAPKLDATKDPPRPVTQGGQQILIPVGSTSVRSAILDTQPLLGLHGHIHETKNGTKLKKSVLVDPGSEYTSGTLRGVLVNLEPKKVLSYQFTSG
jgi:Icc-related predicted phosphoesterase